MNSEPSKNKNMSDERCNDAAEHQNDAGMSENEEKDKVVGDFLSKVTEKNLTTYVLGRCKQEVEREENK